MVVRVVSQKIISRHKGGNTDGESAQATEYTNLAEIREKIPGFALMTTGNATFEVLKGSPHPRLDHTQRPDLKPRPQVVNIVTWLYVPKSRWKVEILVLLPT